MRKKSKLLNGVGINDAAYPITIREDFGGKLKIVWACQMYQVWTSMIKRCYSEKFQARRPSYAGCSVTTEWHKFSSFRAWMLEQPWVGNQLDKDLLKPGNKVYSPDTCVFVPAKLNIFIIDRSADRGEWPLGVCWHNKSGKLQSQCSNPFTGKNDSLGLFTDPGEAHEAWRAKKHEHACRYADQQTDPRIAEALRTRYLEVV